MIPTVDQVKHVEAYTLWIRFHDGKAGLVDLTDELWGPMFEPLRDVDQFRKARVNSELGTISWPNGSDLAPEFLYQCATQGQPTQATGINHIQT